MNNAGQLYFGVEPERRPDAEHDDNRRLPRRAVAPRGRPRWAPRACGCTSTARWSANPCRRDQGSVVRGCTGGSAATTYASWPSRSTSDYFAGTIDEVAVYPRVLSAAQVASHYTGATAGNSLPTAAFTLRRLGLTGHVQRFRVLGHRRHHRVVCVGLRRRSHGHRCDAEPLLRGGRRPPSDAHRDRQRRRHWLHHQDRHLGGADRPVRDRRLQQHRRRRVGHGGHRRGLDEPQPRAARSPSAAVWAGLR